MVKPIPIPPLFTPLESCNLPKNLKSFLKSSYEMPIPVSLTIVHKNSFLLKILKVMPPLKVNLQALPNKLKSTCLYLF